MHVDSQYKRAKFVRYADDFIIGVIGSKEDCASILAEINTFFSREIKLTLNLEKSKITHARNNMAHFLGTDIRITPTDKRPIRRVTRGYQSYLLKSNTRPQLLAPIQKLVDKLTLKGLARQGGTPHRWGKMIHFQDHQIVNRMWSMWLGLSNFYSFADNFGALGRIYYIIKYSCVLTLSLKHKLKTAKGAFRKYGKDLIIKNNDKVVASFPRISLAKPRKFLGGKLNTDPMYRLDKLAAATFRTRKMFDQSCRACGSNENIQIHHVRKLKDSSRKIKMDYLTSMMARMNRKQIPLCADCHTKLHSGKPLPSLKEPQK